MIYKHLEEIDLSKYDDVLTITIKGHVVPLWRAMERYLKVVNDKKGNKVEPFKLNFAQKALYRQICEQKLHGKPMRQTILKARQLGCSTFIAGVFFMEAMFTTNTRWCVLADKKDHAQNIFEMYQFFYDHLNDCYPENIRQEIKDYPKMHRGEIHPADMCPKLDTKQKGKVMITTQGHSRIEVIVASESSGRSASYTGVHSSETAFQRGLKKTITALDATVKSTNANTMVFFETTANGFNEFKDKWDNDIGGLTEYEATFFPWYVEPMYRENVNDALEESNLRHTVAQIGWLNDKWKKYKDIISPPQMLWYLHRFYATDKENVLQENPFEPLDAFKSTGQSIFDLEKISERINDCYNCSRLYGVIPYEKKTMPNDDILFKSKEFLSDDSGHWIVYKLPEKGIPYVCIADPSGGHGQDYSCVQVINNITWEQCAIYLCNTTDQVDCAYELMAAGYYYNTALVSMENNEINRRGIDILVRAHYPKVYIDRDRTFENTNQIMTPRLGHSTNASTRDGLIEDFRIGFKDKPSIICDSETLVEMQNFQYIRSSVNGSLKAQAPIGKHDDAVMAFAPFWKVREQQSKTIGEVNKPNDDGEMTFEELQQAVWKRNEERAETYKDANDNGKNQGWC